MKLTDVKLTYSPGTRRGEGRICMGFFEDLGDGTSMARKDVKPIDITLDALGIVATFIEHEGSVGLKKPDGTNAVLMLITDESMLQALNRSHKGIMRPKGARR